MPETPDENAFPSPAGRAETSGISRRPVLEYFNATLVRGRFRRLFSSREKMTEAIKTLGWVVPLTLLIWIYAEREQVVQNNSPNVQNVVVTIKSSDPNLFVESAGASTPTVNLQLTGPQQAFEKVKEALSMRIPQGTQGLTIDVGSIAIGKNQPVRVVDAIQNLDIFKSNGVTVQESQPSELRVDVDKKLGKEVPVLIPSTIANLAPESHFEPAKILISGPESVVRDIDAVYAKLDGNDLLNQPGPHVIPTVPVELSTPTTKVTMSASQVQANVIVRASDVPYEITEPVPIYVEMLETMLTSNDFVLTNGDSTLANVHVTGPQRQIDQIKSGKFQVKALLIVPSDAGNASISTTPEFILPPGVKVSPEDARRTVEFKLSRH